MISGAEVTAIVLSLETTGPMLIRALGKEKWVLVPCKGIHKRRYRRHTDLHIQPHSKAISDGKVPRVKCSTFSYLVDHQLRLPQPKETEAFLDALVDALKTEQATIERLRSQPVGDGELWHQCAAQFMA